MSYHLDYFFDQISWWWLKNCWFCINSQILDHSVPLYINKPLGSIPHHTENKLLSNLKQNLLHFGQSKMISILLFVVISNSWVQLRKYLQCWMLQYANLRILSEREKSTWFSVMNVHHFLLYFTLNFHLNCYGIWNLGHLNDRCHEPWNNCESFFIMLNKVFLYEEFYLSQTYLKCFMIQHLISRG